MGTDQYTSVKAVVRKVNSDFAPSNNGWYADAMAWIGEGLEEIGTGIVLEKTFKEFKVTDYKMHLPSYVVNVLGVVYNNHRLPLLNGTTDIDVKYQDAAMSGLFAAPYCKVNYYMKSRPKYLDFSFEKGTIKLFYKGLAVDCDGFPLIPDNVFFLEALSYRILFKLLSRGMTHPVWTVQTALQMWEEYKSRAIGIALMPSPDEWETIMNNWNQLIPNADNIWR